MTGEQEQRLDQAYTQWELWEQMLAAITALDTILGDKTVTQERTRRHDVITLSSVGFEMTHDRVLAGWDQARAEFERVRLEADASKEWRPERKPVKTNYVWKAEIALKKAA